MGKIFFSLLALLFISGCHDQTPQTFDLESFDVIIEIPANSGPVKYEMDKNTGRLIVDRFLSPNLSYPVNYGYIPNTLSNDGDPTDVIIITPYPVISGASLRVRPIAILQMEDEAGLDNKILAIPTNELYQPYDAIKSKDDVDAAIIKKIEHFFASYKNAEPNKWSKIHGWQDAEAAKQEILESLNRYHDS